MARFLLLVACFVIYTCEAVPIYTLKPLVSPPTETSYTVLFSVDEGGFRGIIASRVLIEAENSIKRFILSEKPELLPQDTDIKTIEDFEILLADFVDAFAGNSAGAWITTYLASKGGNGAAGRIFQEKRIIEEYGVIPSGSARGLVVFFFEFANAIYPQDMITTELDTLGTDPATPGVVTPMLMTDKARSVFQGFLGDTTFSELSASLFVTAVDITNPPRSILFVYDNVGETEKVGFTEVTRRNGPKSREDRFSVDIRGHFGLDFYLRDAALASGVAPIYHAAEEVRPANASEPTLLLLDGLLTTAIPAFPALLQIVNSTQDTDFSRIAVFSVGNGFPQVDLVDNANGGFEQWTPSNDLLFFGLWSQDEILDKQIKFLFESSPDVKPGQYLRLQLFPDLGTALNQLTFTSLFSTFLPQQSAAGEAFAEQFRPSIDFFVENFVFA